MYTIPNTLTITDLRRQSAQIMKQLPQEKLYLLIQNSKAKGAIIDIEYLKTLQKAYEEYLDILTFDKAMKDKNNSVSWKKYKQKAKLLNENSS